MEIRDIAWLAGLLEGEGCFSTATSKSPIIQLAMCDRDVVEHAARLFGAKRRPKSHDHPGRWKPQWVTAVYGNRAAGWMMTLYPLLARRRRQKIRAILAVWRTYVAHQKEREFCKRGHRLAAENVLRAQWTDARGVVHHEARRCRECHNAYVRQWRRDRAA